jgi:hypothetical protein
MEKRRASEGPRRVKNLGGGGGGGGGCAARDGGGMGKLLFRVASPAGDRFAR